MLFPSPRSSPDSLCLATTYVRGFGILGLVTALTMGIGALATSSPVLGTWAVLGAVLAGGAGLQLWRRKPDAGLLVGAVSMGAVPAAVFGSGGEFPAMMATGSLIGVAVVLVDSDRRKMLARLGLVYGSLVGATLVHAHLVGGSGSIPEAIIGSVVLGVAFGVTYLLFNTSYRVAQYDHGVHRALFENAGDGVVVVDGRGTITRSNPAAEEIFGFGSGEMVGRPVSVLLPPRLREDHDRHLAEAIGGQGGSRPMWNRPVLEAMRAWGETFPAEISITTFDVGARRMAAATVRDVSRRVEAERQARERLVRYRELYERVPVALYRTTPAGRFEGGNPALVELLGADSLDELLATDVVSLFADPAERERVLAQMEDGEGEAVFGIVTLDGRRLWVRDHGRAVRDEDGRIVAYEGAVEDVTEQVEAVAALEESAAAQQRLIAAVAHNLRTPLTVVLGYADLLEQGSGCGEDVTEYARLVREHAYELSALVDEVVLASRLDGDGEPLSVVRGERVRLADAVDEALAAIERTSGAARVRVEAVDLSAVGDPLRLRQAIQLVLSHVLRHGGDDVAVDVHPSADGTVRVGVSYRGPAVPEGEREELFSPFAASAADSVQPARLNLGLWAARKIARLMAGELTYVDGGERSRFELTLPAAPEAPATAGAPGSEEGCCSTSGVAGR